MINYLYTPTKHGYYIRYCNVCKKPFDCAWPKTTTVCSECEKC